MFNCSYQDFSKIDKNTGKVPDIWRFLELYKDFGIDCKVNINDKTGGFYIVLGESRYSDDDVTESEKFQGYGGFYSDVAFDKDGKFISQGFWE